MESNIIKFTSVAEGEASYSVELSMPFVSVSVGSDGKPASTLTYKCGVSVMKGSSKLLPSTTATSGTYKLQLTTTTVAGLKNIAVNNTTGEVSFATDTATALSSGSIEFSVLLEGDDNSVAKSINFTALQGLSGSDGVTYSFAYENGSVYKFKNGDNYEYTPKTFTIAGYRRQGTDARERMTNTDITLSATVLVNSSEISIPVSWDGTNQVFFISFADDTKLTVSGTTDYITQFNIRRLTITVSDTNNVVVDKLLLDVNYGTSDDAASLVLNPTSIIGAVQNTKIGFDSDGMSVYRGGMRVYKGVDSTSDVVFEVDNSGNLTVQGEIKQGSEMAGWAINDHTMLSGNGAVGIGDGDTLSPAGDYSFWAGSTTPAQAPFAVKKDGEVTATKLKIGGTQITDGTITADQLALGSVTVEKLASEVGQSLDLSSNTSVNALAGDLRTEITTAQENAQGQSLTLEFKNGNAFEYGKSNLSVTAHIWKNGTDVTAKVPVSAIHWARNSGDTEADTTWSDAHSGVVTVTLARDEIGSSCVITCTVDKNTVTGALENSSPAFDHSLLQSSHVTIKDDKVSVKSGGSIDMLADSDINLSSAADLNVQSGGNINVQSGGNLSVESGGNVAVQSGGSVAVNSGGDITVNSGANLNVESGGNIAVKSGGELSVASEGKLSVASGGNIEVASGGKLKVTAEDIELTADDTLATKLSGITENVSGLETRVTTNETNITQSSEKITAQATEISNIKDGTTSVGSVKTSSVEITANGIDVSSTGTVNITGGDLNVKSGGNVVIDSGSSFTVNAESSISMRSGASLAMETTTDEDATINGGMIWHGKNMVVSTDEPTERKNGMVWVQPYEESTGDTFYSGTWSRGVLQETRWDRPVNLELTGTAQGEAPAGTYVCTYSVKVYMYKASSVSEPLDVQVWLSDEYGGTDIDCGVVSMTETGWYEKTVTSSVWLGNAEHIYIRIVGASNTAVLKDKPFTVTASLSTQSTQVSRWIPCNVYYYVQVETSITAPSGLEVNGGISATGASCALTWTASTTTGTTGGVTYIIYKDDAEVVRTTETAYTFSQTDVSSWSNAVLTVKAYNADTGMSKASNSVTFTYEAPATATVVVNASKYATTDNSSLANKGGTKCNVGRATKSAVVGTAMQFLAPDAGWDSFTKATLYVQRTAGTASASIKFGKMTVPYSDTLYTTQFYYGNYATAIGSVDVGAATVWTSIDISNYLPSGSDELGITLMSENAYCLVDGTNAYIVLEN